MAGDECSHVKFLDLTVGLRRSLFVGYILTTPPQGCMYLAPYETKWCAQALTGWGALQSS